MDIQSVADKLQRGTQTAPKQECQLNLHFSDCEEEGTDGKAQVCSREADEQLHMQESERKHSFLANSIH